MISLCCLLNRSLICGSLSNELVKGCGGVLAGCRFIVMKFCLLNKKKELWSLLAITHVYVDKLDILCFKI